MFVIVAYDVQTKRVAKVMKICRKYLNHAQKSVFEGTITEAKLKSLKNDLRNVIDYENDGICIYEMASVSGVIKEEIGVTKVNSNII